MKNLISNMLFQKIFNKVFALTFGTITHVDTKIPAVALTFDDGPHPHFTPRVLDILSDYDARATFFMIGKAASQYPHVVKQVAEAGHSIGNHSWDHQSFTDLTKKQRRDQICKCKKALYPYGEMIFRPPKGYQHYASRLDAFFLKYKVITWNVLVEDWKDLTAETMLNILIANIEPGSIILLHDAVWDPLFQGVEDRTTMLEALERFLNRVHTRFQFVTVPDLLKLGRPQHRVGLKIHEVIFSPVMKIQPLRTAFTEGALKSLNTPPVFFPQKRRE